MAVTLKYNKDLLFTICQRCCLNFFRFHCKNFVSMNLSKTVHFYYSMRYVNF